MIVLLQLVTLNMHLFEALQKGISKFRRVDCSNLERWRVLHFNMLALSMLCLYNSIAPIKNSFQHRIELTLSATGKRARLMMYGSFNVHSSAPVSYSPLVALFGRSVMKFIFCISSSFLPLALHLSTQCIHFRRGTQILFQWYHQCSVLFPNKDIPCGYGRETHIHSKVQIFQ